MSNDAQYSRDEWVDSMETLEDKPNRPKRPNVGTRPFTEGAPKKKISAASVKRALKFLAGLNGEERDALKVALQLVETRAQKK